MRLEKDFILSVDGLIYIQTFLLCSTLFIVSILYIYFHVVRGGKDDLNEETEEEKDDDNNGGKRIVNSTFSEKRVLVEEDSDENEEISDKEENEDSEEEITQDVVIPLGKKEDSEEDGESEDESEDQVEIEVGNEVPLDKKEEDHSLGKEEENNDQEEEEAEEGEDGGEESGEEQIDEPHKPFEEVGKEEESGDEEESVEVIKVQNIIAQEDPKPHEESSEVNEEVKQVNEVHNIVYESGVIIDVGEETTRCGLSGDDFPRSTFPTLVGRPKKLERYSYSIIKHPDVVVGDHWHKRSFLDIKSPFEKEYFEKWSDLEELYKHVYNEELERSADDQPVLITEPPLSKKNDREKIVTTMFEVFSVPAMYLANKCVMSLYSTHRTTGIVLDVGLKNTYSVPVYEGHAIKHAIRQIPLGGDHISETLIRCIQKENDIFYDWNWCKYQDRKIVNDIKKKCCYFAVSGGEDNDETSIMMKKKKYILPDASEVVLGSVLHESPEILFDPSSLGGYYGVHYKYHGVHDMLCRSIHKTSPELQERMYENIVLSGGSTMLECFDQRLVKEVTSHMFTPRKRDLVSIVKSSHDRSLSSYIGASLFTSLSSFNNMWVTKDEYDDAGATIVHRKCFC